MHSVVIICCALLGLLAFGLGFNVSVQRNKTKTGISPGTDPTSPLMKAVRAHGNSVEYGAILIGLFVVLSLTYSDRNLGLFASALVIVITLARGVHAFGMLTCVSLDKSNPFRFIGALTTYLAGFVLCAVLIGKAF